MYPGDAIIETNTQVGNDLLLTETAFIDARVGVAGNVVANGGFVYDDDPDDINNRMYNLTVNAGKSLYAGEDIVVNQITVDGHVEADNYHIWCGYVVSDETLIARGSIYLYNNAVGHGRLIIGDGTQATAGSVIVGDELTNGVDDNDTAATADRYCWHCQRLCPRLQHPDHERGRRHRHQRRADCGSQRQGHL